MDLSVTACATYAAVTPVLFIAAYLSSDSLRLFRGLPWYLRACIALFGLVIAASIWVAGKGVATGGLTGYSGYFAQTGFAGAVGALMATFATQVLIKPDERKQRDRPRDERPGGETGDVGPGGEAGPDDEGDAPPEPTENRP